MLLADARLDNPDELEERVGGLAGRSDADLLLALWLREGENCLAQIAGDFAIAIFDPRTGSLSLARDVTGQRPLFYTQMDFGLVFGSMAAGLRPAFLNFSVNRRSLALLAMDAPIDSGELFFDGVSSVGQAEVVRFSSSGRPDTKILLGSSVRSPRPRRSKGPDRRISARAGSGRSPEAGRRIRCRGDAFERWVRQQLGGGHRRAAARQSAGSHRIYVGPGLRNSAGSEVWLFR